MLWWSVGGPRHPGFRSRVSGDCTVTLEGSLGAQAVRRVFGSTSLASKHCASGHRVPESKASPGPCGVPAAGPGGVLTSSCCGYGVLSVLLSGFPDLRTAAV